MCVWGGGGDGVGGGAIHTDILVAMYRMVEMTLRYILSREPPNLLWRYSGIV